jgi:hypothetical protein
MMGGLDFWRRMAGWCDWRSLLFRVQGSGFRVQFFFPSLHKLRPDNITKDGPGRRTRPTPRIAYGRASGQARRGGEGEGTAGTSGLARFFFIL